MLAFNSASLNSLTGWTVDWFKLTWMTLGSFGFAIMAWVVSPWFLVVAVQMYGTGMLMYRFPEWAYILHGVSWCLALQGIGLVLERMRTPVRKRQVRAAEYAGRHIAVPQMHVVNGDR